MPQAASLDSPKPEAYPADLEAMVRSIVLADTGEIERGYAEPDAETLLHRFFTVAVHLGEKQIHYVMSR